MTFNDRLEATASPISRECVLSLIPKSEKLKEGKLKCVARISNSIVVKFGLDVRLCEARNMIFAASLPGIRVPKVYDAWETTYGDPNDGTGRMTCYIVMEYVSGRTLASAWSDLSPQNRTKVYQQLGDSIATLHAQRLTRPGPIGGGESRGRLFTMYNAGPFESIDEIEKWFNDRQRVCKDYRRVYEDEPDFSGAFKELVMCHMDLHMYNIILDLDDNAWILDWGNAGAYPVFLEDYMLELNTHCYSDEYYTGLRDALSTGRFPNEVKRLNGLTFAITTGVFLKPLNSSDEGYETAEFDSAESL